MENEKNEERRMTKILKRIKEGVKEGKKKRMITKKK